MDFAEESPTATVNAKEPLGVGKLLAAALTIPSAELSRLRLPPVAMMLACPSPLMVIIDCGSDFAAATPT